MGNDSRTYLFGEVLLAPEHFICFVKLKPFSLGHWSILEQYSSPLLSAEEYPDPYPEDAYENYTYCIRHIFLFLLVCAHSYEDNIRLIEDDEFFKKTKEEFEETLIRMIREDKEWNIFKVTKDIKAYLSYYINSMPEFVEKGQPSPPSGIDWMQNLYAIMKNEYGYTESEIMNMSMKRLYSEWVTYAAKNGAIEVKSKQRKEAEKQAAEYVKNLVSKKKAEAEVKA